MSKKLEPLPEKFPKKQVEGKKMDYSKAAFPKPGKTKKKEKEKEGDG